MKALDTNILARYLLDDDPAQSALARRQLQEPCLVTPTVLLELAWLLKSYYRLPRAEVVANLKDLIMTPELSVANAERVIWAIDRFADGGDFADMMHIATAEPAEAFVTFERRLDKLAGPDTPVRIERLTA